MGNNKMSNIIFARMREEDIKTIARLAFDTPQARRTILLKAMIQKEILSLTEAAELLRGSEYKADRALGELAWIGIVEQDGLTSEWHIRADWRKLIKFVFAKGGRGWTQHLLERDCRITSKTVRRSPKPRLKLLDGYY